jgi:hypothetical protein
VSHGKPEIFLLKINKSSVKRMACSKTEKSQSSVMAAKCSVDQINQSETPLEKKNMIYDILIFIM